MQECQQKKLMKSKIFKLAFFSSTRGDMSILQPLIERINQNKNFNYLFFVYGTHLSKHYGNTIEEIKKNKIIIRHQQNTISKKDDFKGLTNSLALSQKFMNKIFANNDFDAVIILGDRVEKLPIILNAIIYRKLIFHIHGGEITSGALDDQVRHMITKSAHLHLPICEDYKKNIIKMAEEKFRILNAGSLAVENIKKYKKKIKYKKQYVLLTYHPETIKKNFNWIKNFKIIIKVLKKFKYKTIITSPGHEIGSNKNINFIKNFVKKNKDFKFFSSLGSANYFKILNKALFVIGNSSSGIIEVPYFKIPTINIGDRQKGRFFHKSIIHCKCDEKQIEFSIQKSLSKKFQKKISNMKFHFGNGDSSEKILKFILKNLKDMNKLINKKFIRQ